MDVQPSQSAVSTLADNDRGVDPDRLGAEVRESALLLVLSLAVTAGLSAGAQALLSLAG